MISKERLTRPVDFALRSARFNMVSSGADCKDQNCQHVEQDLTRNARQDVLFRETGVRIDFPSSIRIVQDFPSFETRTRMRERERKRLRQTKFHIHTLPP